MFKHCEKCKKDFESSMKKCPICASKLEKRFTEEELLIIQKENEDFTVINTNFFM